MNYLEAIRSGKPYRRKHWDVGIYQDAYVSNNYQHAKPLRILDILAEDWEVKQEPREWWISLDLRDGNQWVCVESILKPAGNWIKVREVIEGEK